MVKRIAAVGAVCGLIVCGGVLMLMWFGVSGVLKVGQTNVKYIIWPTAIVLTVGWRTTPLGIFITFCSVVTNCVMYAGVALLVRWGVSLMLRLRRGANV